MERLVGRRTEKQEMRQGKRAVCLAFLCLFLGVVAVGNLSALEGTFFAAGAETNGHAKSSLGVGGVMAIGLDANRYFSWGIKNGMFYENDEMTVFESAGFFRCYVLGKPSLFVQAELGSAFFFRDEKAFTSFIGALAAGWRFDLGKYMYIEPAVRGGYPFMWGAGLMAGGKL